MKAVFVLTLTAMFEDGWDEAPEPVHRYIKCYMATRAVKPATPLEAAA